MVLPLLKVERLPCFCQCNVIGSLYFVKMDYKKALENLRQYNREYSTGNELLESVVACINYIVEDSENESKDDLLEVAEIVKNDLLPKVEQP